MLLWLAAVMLSPSIVALDAQVLLVMLLLVARCAHEEQSETALCIESFYLPKNEEHIIYNENYLNGMLPEKQNAQQANK